MTISCQQCREWLSDLLEDEDQFQPAAPSPQLAAPSLNGTSHGASHAPSRALLLAHLATCADCACDLNMLRNLRAELRRLPQQEAPAELRARVRAQLTATPASAPLLAPPVVGIEHLHQAPAANGHYRPAPRPVAAQSGFLASLTRFFSRPSNLAWASGASLAAFGLVLFTQERPHIVMPTTGEPAATPQAIALAPQNKKPSGEHGAATTSHASAPGTKLAAVAKPQLKNRTPNDTAPAPDAALPAPATSVPDASESASNRHGHIRQGLTSQGSSNVHDRTAHSAPSAMTSHGSPEAHGNKVAPANAATAPTPQSAHEVPNNAVTPPATTGTGEMVAQAPDANAPFARMTLAANDTSDKANSTQGNPVAPVPNAPGNVAPTAPANVEPTAPGLPISGGQRIAILPGRNHQPGAPPRPQTLIKPTPVTPALDFGSIGAERTAHLVVVPPRDIKAARLDVTLSSGLSYTDQTQGNWRMVWQGAAQQGKPIAVDLHLVASASGTQQVKVVLKETGATEATAEDATPVQDETLNLNVTAPTGTNP